MTWFRFKTACLYFGHTFFNTLKWSPASTNIFQHVLAYITFPCIENRVVVMKQFNIRPSCIFGRTYRLDI
jgi:hypothetical protein